MEAGSSDEAGALVVDPARVVHETVDGEAIIIQLERANYYSLRGCGREIWEMVCQGHPPAEIAAHLEAAYEAKPGEIAADVEQLIGRLKQEGLVTEAAGQGANGDRRPARPRPDLGGGTYTGSQLEKYTDMQDFLLLDPIHDVTSEGWPVVDRGN